ncbi:MAG TPA: MarR family transcriptional regulator [Acidimicrobiales bacterium]|nr:MarR family transcriptional regulator [Acidimicrobiales bacterium]
MYEIDTSYLGRREEAIALRVAVARIHRALRTRLEWSVTASQASALARVEGEGTLRLGALAQREGVSPATMSKVVDGLVELGLVERAADSEDRRASRIRLTGEGIERLAQLRASSTALISAAISDLSEWERARLDGALPVLERLADLLTGAEVAVPS